MIASSTADLRWQFWIDRGGTFTDIVAYTPDKEVVVHKLLSENPERYTDASLQGIRDVLGIAKDALIPTEQIAVVKMGTTVATNALLERKGDRTILVITKGFRDALRIGYQNRPDIFARQIVLPEMLYERVIEVEERCSAQGEILNSLNPQAVREAFRAAYDEGVRACAIVLMHGYRYPEHERQLAALAREIGFTQVSVSHEVSPLMKLVSRGDTTVVDAYLSPILGRYVDRVAQDLGDTQLMFMQSNGGLADARFFRGKDSILSGPAGGVVGAGEVSTQAGFEKIISFDMGGTSTDVAHYDGEYERAFEMEIAGVRLKTPIMSIHTVAAGGGSILLFDGARYQVGPESAGADPGPACYRKGGPLTVTDCNVMLGKIQPDFFPKVFGPNGALSLDRSVVREKFSVLADEIKRATGDMCAAEQVAEGFLAVAVDNMANAIKKISIQRGHDVSEYTLCCFGAAGGQHACLIADALGISQVLIHPYAGVLSAYGMGLADRRVLREQAMEAKLSADLVPELNARLDELAVTAREELSRQGTEDIKEIRELRKAHLRYEGTDSTLMIDVGEPNEMVTGFEQAHHQRYGFIMPDKDLIVEAVAVELVGKTTRPAEPVPKRRPAAPPLPVTTVSMFTAGTWHKTAVFDRSNLRPGDSVPVPAIIVEATGTNVIEVGWQAEITERNHLVLKRSATTDRISKRVAERSKGPAKPDPVMLEIFNNLFMSIAEQMGVTLRNTSYSVNIKERLDFSCAIFDLQGYLVANAPHIPVHLGSMGESVQSLIAACGDSIKPGDVYALNNPYNGGTHLPDITVITPVFDEANERIVFYAASRGHHADIGGITPGSMPPNSVTVDEEGVFIDNFKLIDQGHFREQELWKLLTSGPYPARNPTQNIADLKAQIGANKKGVQELHRMVAHYSLPTVQAYMTHVQNNAEESVRRVIDVLKSGRFCYALDDGSEIHVTVNIDRASRSAKIDFTGTSPQQHSNFNAPLAVCKAAVLYVFRTLVDSPIPLNAGCLKPLEIIVPENSLLNPRYPAAVVAGNVETSQAIVDALYGALGVMAASQGTMNNFTFGNDHYQYYETICGGSGAGQDFDGADAVHTHMTNSRLTDPEVLEWRFPVLLEDFAVRQTSGGNGYHCGGNGIVRRIRFRKPMTAAVLSSRRRVPPFGLQGGQPGALGHNYVERQSGVVEELGGTAIVEMRAGDVFVIETPGGGGYGTPREGKP